MGSLTQEVQLDLELPNLTQTQRSPTKIQKSKIIIPPTTKRKAAARKKSTKITKRKLPVKKRANQNMNNSFNGSNGPIPPLEDILIKTESEEINLNMNEEVKEAEEMTSSFSNPSGGGTTRRIFTTEFKKRVLEAFNTDPECIGNQRATARKFNIHRRQVQKWLTQLGGVGGNDKETTNLSTSNKSPEAEKDYLDGENEEEVEQISPPSPSPSSEQEDLSRMSSAAMALSLNLSLANSQQSNNNNNNNNNNTLSSKLANRNSPTPPPFPSPNSILSRLYNFALPPQKQPTNTSQKSHKNPSRGSNNNSQGNANSSNRGTSSSYLQILDEIASNYPNEDFNLLRQALLRNEVSFTKVPPSAKSNFYSSKPPPSPPSYNNYSPNPDKNAQNFDKGPPPSKNALAALQLLRQQSEYVKLFQNSGIGLNELRHHSPPEPLNGKEAPWLHPLFMGGALGDLLPNGGGGGNGLNGHKKNSGYVFASPKPVSSGNGKPKTVAAALAASRLSPNSLLGGGIYESLGLSGGGVKRGGQKKRGGKKAKTSSTATRPGDPTQDEEYLDPTSMLEVTTETTNGRTNGGGSEEHVHYANNLSSPYLNGGISYTPPKETAASSHIQKYLEQFSRKSPEEEPDPELITKNAALEAFTYDSEVAGDCRAVARKFGLNVRLVMKWIKESSGKMNSYVNSNGHGEPEHDDDEILAPPPPPPPPSSSNKRKTSKPNQICDYSREGVEFLEEEISYNDEEPLDMMVPIKKRRISSHD